MVQGDRPYIISWPAQLLSERAILSLMPVLCLQAPLRFDRENLTTTLPARDTAAVTFDNCSFSCPTITESLSSYEIVSRSWSPLELLSALKLEDSRMILLQQSLTTPNNSWGSIPLLIAESRYASPDAMALYAMPCVMSCHVMSCHAMLICPT